jgi:hypothetical protein
MSRRTKWMAITLVVAAVLAIGVGATVASAATPTATPEAQICGAGGGGWRFGGVVVDEAVTKLLGMTESEIKALRQEGNSLAQIAATKNVGENQLVDAIMEYKTAHVQSRVTAGTITQDQANLMIQTMEENTTQAVNRTSTGPTGGRVNGYGLRGSGAGNGTGSCTGTCTGQGKMNRAAR